MHDGDCIYDAVATAYTRRLDCLTVFDRRQRWQFMLEHAIQRWQFSIFVYILHLSVFDYPAVADKKYDTRIDAIIVFLSGTIARDR